MINSIKNGDQPLPRVTQVSIAETSSNEQPPLKDKSMWSGQEKKIQKIDRLARSLLIQGLLNDIYSLIDSNKTTKDLWDALARHMLGSEYVINDLKKCGYSKDNCAKGRGSIFGAAAGELMEQMTQLTSMCKMACQLIQKKQEEKRIEEEQAANARYWKIPAYCDYDDDYNSAITPNEPIDSLSMGDEHLNTIPAIESDEFIKLCVENLVPNPSESKGENGYDVPACFTNFLNILFDAEYEFNSSDDQSLSDEDFLKEIFSNPLFEEEIIPMKIDQHHFNDESDLIESMLNHDSYIISSSSKIDSLLDEFAGELTLLKSISPGIDKTDCYPEEDILLIERLLYDNSSPHPPEEFVSKNSNAAIEYFFPSPIPVEDSDSFMEEIDLSFNPDDPMPPGIEDDDDDDSERDILIRKELLDNYSLSLPEKSPDLLSHRRLEIFQLSAKCPMMIHGKNIPILDVPLFQFYPLDQFNIPGNLKTLAKDFILQVFISSASVGN
nr:hypothetical protein [Tanacetum cinerariifolium]